MHKVVSDTGLKKLTEAWGIKPVYWVERAQQDKTPSLSIQLFHRCSRSKGWKYCKLDNRDEVMRDSGASARYMCQSCGMEAPFNIVKMKHLAKTHGVGYDPRNNRKAAILATKQKRNS